MAGDLPLAHSSRSGISAQSYPEHVTSVRHRAISNASRAATFYNGNREAFVNSVGDAALYHDLGKLDKTNQEVLEEGSRHPLPLPHEDAGVAALWALRRKESAVFVAAHHAGLFSKSVEAPPSKRRPFRNEQEFASLSCRSVDEHVDAHLHEYLTAHKEAGLCTAVETISGPLHRCGFTRRIGLACLVDADHGDTARHYANEIGTPEIEPQWEARLASLMRYVDGLPEGDTKRKQHRNYLRRKLFEACRDAAIEPPIRACDAPVGSGKTTAVMAHLLRIATERRPQMRHIIVVLPYTNIIAQAVEIYRKALVLEGEEPEEIVAEHHHRADFGHQDLRQYTSLWKAPIIVTTAVQFFETLGAHHPSRLRKLHELPGSAVFVDEMHAAMPSHLWPQMWRWLQTWTKDWRGHLVLASGSLARFWQIEEYRELIDWGIDGSGTLERIPDLVSDEQLKRRLRESEARRISYRRRPPNAAALDCHGLVDLIHKKKGPRLLIVNTVHTAAVVAGHIRERGYDVLHLSTAIAPAHRDLLVGLIRQRLRGGTEDWTLVATSCVEAGMDFSFRTGFRERATTASLIQVGGRVNRGDEHGDAEVWDLLLRDDQFRANPAMKVGRDALDRLQEEELNHLSAAHLTTRAMREEWTAGANEKARLLVMAEAKMDYPGVAEMCRVIETDTVTVLIDPRLAEAVRRRAKVSKVELLRYTVQIWSTKITELALDPIGKGGDLYAWKHAYDPAFLGYMAGVLELESFKKDPEALVL